MTVKKDRNRSQSMEGRIDVIREELYNQFPAYYSICTFDDAVIYIDDVSSKLYEMVYVINSEGIPVFGEPKEVAETYVQKRIFSESFDFSDISKVGEASKSVELLVNDWGSFEGDKDKCLEAIKEKEGIINPEALYSWLFFEVEGKWPTQKVKASEKGAELTGPIVFKNDEQRIVLAAVLVPGEPDFDYDKGEMILTKEEVQRIAWNWMEDYANIDVMHGLNNVAVPIESYLLPVEWTVTAYGKSMTLPVGTWIMGGKVKDDAVWKDIKDGKLTGFSIMGIPKTALKRIIERATKGINIAEEFKTAMKRVLLKDLGKDWLAPFVSIVDEPCVPKAKFFAIKSKEVGLDEVKKKGILEKIKNIFVIDAEKKGRVISDSTLNHLKKAWESLGSLIKKAEEERDETEKNKEGEIDMTNEEIQVLVEKAIDEKLKPISESLELITNKLAEKKEEVKEPEPVKAVEPTAEELAKKAKDEEIVNKLQEKVKELDEFIKKGKSNAIKGDDNIVVKEEVIVDNRDSLGRAKKKRY